MSTDAIQQLAQAATSRADAAEDRLRIAEERIRVLELADARRDGAQGQVSRAPAWLAVALSAAALAANLLERLLP